MVLVWILGVDPIIRPMWLVSTLTVCVQVGRLSLLETKAICENATFFFFLGCAFASTHNTKSMGMFDCQS